jgi:radical SAM superfamily enzyme YgiQ (UPF0313 family)
VKKEKITALLVYPEYPVTFWSYKHALKFISKKASSPPLGLLTVAAMLPEEWTVKLVDLNVTSLLDKDIEEADFVLISAMSIQQKSAREIISRCKQKGVKTVAGGPLFTSNPDAFSDVDHLVLDEAEITLPLFLEDIKNATPQRLYTTDQWADITTTPAPRWNLINLKHYASLNIQYSRGCPFSCEFCDITVLYGHTPRVKEGNQIIAELARLYQMGWRGGVFFVDDNFIGNKMKLKKEVLPALTAWMKEFRYPFAFNTEASINLADDAELMRLMVEAGFDTVFVGIETPEENSLTECHKSQNRNRDLLSCVKEIQRAGLQVQAGFIVGFDSDPPSIFDRMTRFIQESGIATAMVGLLNAPRGTKLHERMKSEGRLLDDVSGDNMDASINFIPRMNSQALLAGYQKVLDTIYSPRHYYERVKRFLREYKPGQNGLFQFKAVYLVAFLKSVLYLGVIGRERIQYWKLLAWSLCIRPRLLPLAITLAIYGFHFRKVTVAKTV